LQKQEENSMGLISSLKKAFSKPYKTVSVAGAKELLASGAALIDIRTVQEWRSGRAPQAKYVPAGQVQCSTTGIQKTRPVIAMCASGIRSASAARLLASHGCEVYSLRGGMSACRQAGEPSSPFKRETKAEISINEAEQCRSTARVLDVREDFEVAEGMIPQALHIPMGQLQARLSELDPAVPVIAVCRSGNRSARVADALNGAGFSADTMTGRMIAWSRAGLPTT
jgi:rhodanese-related sulfurtransferase